jgi:hypothetical protein
VINSVAACLASRGSDSAMRHRCGDAQTRIARLEQLDGAVDGAIGGHEQERRQIRALRRKFQKQIAAVCVRQADIADHHAETLGE